VSSRTNGFLLFEKVTKPVTEELGAPCQFAESKSLLVQNLLARPDMHRQWEGDYRTAGNEEFYDRALDYILSVFDPPPDATFLDAGCGPCAHSVRLAQRGFNVHAVDFSESALGIAREYIESQEIRR
jgi:ubiquinone/menaquinone biosynthesis C-methylase UbiE